MCSTQLPRDIAHQILVIYTVPVHKFKVVAVTELGSDFCWHQVHLPQLVEGERHQLGENQVFGYGRFLEERRAIEG